MQIGNFPICTVKLAIRPATDGLEVAHGLAPSEGAREAGTNGQKTSGRSRRPRPSLRRSPIILWNESICMDTSDTGSHHSRAGRRQTFTTLRCVRGGSPHATRVTINIWLRFVVAIELRARGLIGDGHFRPGPFLIGPQLPTSPVHPSAPRLSCSPFPTRTGTPAKSCSVPFDIRVLARQIFLPPFLCPSRPFLPLPPPRPPGDPTRNCRFPTVPNGLYHLPRRTRLASPSCPHPMCALLKFSHSTVRSRSAACR